MVKEIKIVDYNLKINDRYADLVQEQFDLLLTSATMLEYNIEEELFDHFNDDVVEYNFIEKGGKRNFRILFLIDQEDSILTSIDLYIHKNSNLVYKVQIKQNLKYEYVTDTHHQEISYLFKTAMELGLGGGIL